MQCSHSRLECFESCPFKYKLRYLERLKVLPSDKPDDALILGHALHTGIEKGVDAGIREYLMAYPIITDAHINEQIKLEFWIPRVRAALPQGQYEVTLSDSHFIGFIDFLTPATMFHESEVPGLYDLWDFKYTSKGSRYLESEQLHLYKYFFERLNPGKKIRNMNYVIVPKVNIKQKGTESLQDFRRRIESELSKLNIEFLPVTYDPNKVIEFFMGTKSLIEADEYPKNPNYLCNWCEYQDFCQKGLNYMILPKNERRNLNAVTKRVVWLYGAPFSGKTFFANAFPDPIMLNTDGNIKFVDAPFIPIKDKVEVSGRMTKRTLAWEIFKEVIDELEKKQNDFKTIVVDLLEDVYEACRLYMYKEMGITHESDDSFRAWDKVRTEFLSTIRRLMNLDYENIILISHEDTSKDITKKGGDKLTSIKPNLQDKVSNKVAGMVDIVARVIADGDERVLSFKTNEVIFGGGRLTVKEKQIPLDYDAFVQVYAEANKNTKAAVQQDKPTRKPKAEKPDVNPAAEVPAPEAEEPAEMETPAGLAEAVQQEETAAADAADAGMQTVEPNSGEVMEAPAPKPVTRTRKRRGE
jgi:phage nucleotide-binding protein